MREIKFRAWDKQIKQMHYINSMGWDERLEIDYVNIINDKEDTSCFGVDSIAEEVEIMQYTGLKDKNGVEIYEGDFLINHERLKNYVYLVEWSDGGWYITPFVKKGSMIAGISNGLGQGMLVSYDEVDNFEVIGNRFNDLSLVRNSELLQED